MSGPDNFETLVRVHQGAVRAFLRRLARDHAKADDLAQITFMKAYEQRAALQDISAAKAWLFQIAYRSFLDADRKSARRRDLAVQNPDEVAAQPDPILSADIALAMNSLEPDCRAVIILCLAHGLTHAEAARITKLPLGTVKSHISRGKIKLQAFLHAYEAQ